MRRPRFYAIIVIIVIIVGVAMTITIVLFRLSNTTTTILIVRHAERVDASANSNLSETGLARAKALVEIAEDAGVSAIYCTAYCRNAQTAQPAASALGLPLNVQPGTSAAAELGACAPPVTVPTNRLPVPITAFQALANDILTEHAGDVVLVVGHSDTVPGIVAALGAGAFEPFEMDSGEYDRLFVVTVPRYFGAPRNEETRFGE